MTSYLVGVHGIWNYRYFREAGSAAGAVAAISADWAGWLGGRRISVGYYAHHLHTGTPQGADEIETLDEFAAELLVEWVQQLQPTVQITEGPRTARARVAADWLTRKYGTGARAFAAAFAREVATYLRRPDGKRRLAAREEVARAIGEARDQDRVVVVAHSLGSVVTYEALWAHPELRVDLLVTLGSPLGMRGVVFERLNPVPAERGARPPGVRRWVNLSDVGDLVAVPRGGLAEDFDGVDVERTDLTIDEWDFHRVRSYLGCPDVLGYLV